MYFLNSIIYLRLWSVTLLDNDNYFGQISDDSIMMMMIIITNMLIFLRQGVIVEYSLPVSNLFYWPICLSLTTVQGLTWIHVNVNVHANGHECVHARGDENDPLLSHWHDPLKQFWQYCKSSKCCILLHNKLMKQIPYLLK